MVAQIGYVTLEANAGGFAVGLDDAIIDFYAVDIEAFLGTGTGDDCTGVLLSDGWSEAVDFLWRRKSWICDRHLWGNKCSWH